jgi:hypothetical protein
MTALADPDCITTPQISRAHASEAEASQCPGARARRRETLVCHQAPGDVLSDATDGRELFECRELSVRTALSGFGRSVQNQLRGRGLSIYIPDSNCDPAPDESFARSVKRTKGWCVPVFEDRPGHDNPRQAAPRTTEQADPTAERLVVFDPSFSPRSGTSAFAPCPPGKPDGGDLTRSNQRAIDCQNVVNGVSGRYALGRVPVGRNHPSAQASCRVGSGRTNAEPGEGELRDAKRPRPEGERRRAGSKRCMHIVLTPAPVWKHPGVPS